MADFCLVAKRTLEPGEYEIFNYHFMLGADWKLCCRKLNVDRGTFFHEVYRIQSKLGRTFRELEPYALFPIDEYFGGGPRTAEAKIVEIKLDPEEGKRARPILRFPVKRAA